MLCDFCRSPEVVCGFDGPDTAVIMANNEGTSTWHNTGGWASCEMCAQLLESGKLDELTQRALDSEENGMVDEPPAKRELYFALLRDQYEKINRKREAA